MGNHRQVCINCNSPLGRGRADRKYCGDRCRQSAHRHSERQAERVLETRSCAWCFREFNCPKSSNKKFCHRAACKQADYRARMKAGRQGRF